MVFQEIDDQRKLNRDLHQEKLEVAAKAREEFLQEQKTVMLLETLINLIYSCVCFRKMSSLKPTWKNNANWKYLNIVIKFENQKMKIENVNRKKMKQL